MRENQSNQKNSVLSSQKKCSNCSEWVGRCLKGRFTVASSKACDVFTPRKQEALICG